MYLVHLHTYLVPVVPKSDDNNPGFLLQAGKRNARLSYTCLGSVAPHANCQGFKNGVQCT